MYPTTNLVIKHKIIDMITRNINLIRLMQLASAACFVSLSITANAADKVLDLTLPAGSFYTRDVQSFMLASNSTDVVKSTVVIEPSTPAAEFEPPIFSKRKTHQYLGLSTIALAVLTAMTAPEACDEINCPPRDVNGTHATLAKATLAMAAATVASGLYAHWDDFSLADGWSDPDNLHVLLGVTGATLMAYAVNKSANSSTPVSHAAIAETGAVLMVVAIKLTW